MKTFFRKLSRSLWAMTCGWMACNVLLSVNTLDQAMGSWRSALQLAAIYGFYSAVVILVACLVIFLPVDLLISEDSWLRKPRWAAPCGFLAGSCVTVAVYFPYIVKPETWSLNGIYWQALPWVLSPGVTGMVAAWVRNRNTNAPAL